MPAAVVMLVWVGIILGRISNSKRKILGIDSLSIGNHNNEIGALVNSGFAAAFFTTFSFGFAEAFLSFFVVVQVRTLPPLLLKMMI